MYLQKQLISPPKQTQHVLIIWPLYNMWSWSLDNEEALARWGGGGGGGG